MEDSLFSQHDFLIRAGQYGVAFSVPRGVRRRGPPAAPARGAERREHRGQLIIGTGIEDRSVAGRVGRAAALTLLLGIDPVVVMTDIAGVSREQALEVLEWSARTLVEGALRERSSDRPRPAGRRKTRR